jgi:hypothetical protein
MSYLGKGHIKCTFSRCLHMDLQLVLILSNVWRLDEIIKMHGSCLIMSNEFNGEPLSHVMFCIIEILQNI